MDGRSLQKLPACIISDWSQCPRMPLIAINTIHSFMHFKKLIKIKKKNPQKNLKIFLNVKGHWYLIDAATQNTY